MIFIVIVFVYYCKKFNKLVLDFRVNFVQIRKKIVFFDLYRIGQGWGIVWCVGEMGVVEGF